MLTIVGVRTAIDSAGIIERSLEASRLQKSFIAIRTTEETLEFRFQRFVGNVAIGENREGQTVMIALGKVGLRDIHRPTIILSTKQQ